MEYHHLIYKFASGQFKQTIGQCVPFLGPVNPKPTPNKKMMNPIPFPSTLKSLRNTQITRSIHQSEETEPNAKNQENTI